MRLLIEPEQAPAAAEVLLDQAGARTLGPSGRPAWSFDLSPQRSVKLGPVELAAHAGGVEARVPSLLWKLARIDLPAVQRDGKHVLRWETSGVRVPLPGLGDVFLAWE